MEVYAKMNIKCPYRLNLCSKVNINICHNEKYDRCFFYKSIESRLEKYLKKNKLEIKAALGDDGK